MPNHCTECDTQLDAPIAGEQRCPRCGHVFVAEPARRQQPAAGAGTMMPDAWNAEDDPSSAAATLDPPPNPRHQVTVDLPASHATFSSPAGKFPSGGEGRGEPTATFTRTVEPRALSSEELAQMTAIWDPAVEQQTSVETTIRRDVGRTIEMPDFKVRARSMVDVTDPGMNEADYQLLDLLGEGGMGLVHRARQASIDRTVAVKTLKAASARDSSHRDKFLSEAVVTGDLDHPNIVPIYDLGSNDHGELFYAMKCVQGTPWLDAIGAKSLSENLDILMNVADALAFAHDRGVVHRDVKPENVMLGDYGEVLLMDWGLALLLPESPKAARLSQTPSMGGTPAYMAPEMAAGPITGVGRASDVYLLGAVLYEIITGQPPHTGRTVMDCLHAAARNEIVPTEKSGELLNIAMRAMETDPAERYASIQEMQSALRDYQSHSESLLLSQSAEEELAEAEITGQYDLFARSVFGFQEAIKLWEGNLKAKQSLAIARLRYAESAHGKGDLDLAESLLDDGIRQHQALRKRVLASRTERDTRQRLARRIKWIIYGLLAFILVVISVAYVQIRTERDRAVRAEALAYEAAGQEKIAAAEAVRERKRAEEKEELALLESERARAAESTARQAESEAKVSERRAKEAATEAQRARAAEAHEAYIAQIGLASENINENAFGDAYRLLHQYRDSDRRNWEWGRLMYLCRQGVATIDEPAAIDAVAFSPDGATFATGGWDGQARLYRTDTREPIGRFPHGRYVHAVAFSKDGKQLATGADDRTARIWDIKTGQPVQTLSGHTDAVLSVAFSQDGQHLLTSSYDKSARLWNIATGKATQLYQGHSWWVWQARFSPDEQRIVTAGQDGKVMVWNRATARREAEFSGHEGPVYTALFAHDGATIASGGYDQRVLVWDPQRARPVDVRQALAGNAPPPTPFRELRGQTNAIRDLCFSATGKRLASASEDHTVTIWDFSAGRAIKTLRGHAQTVHSCQFSPDGKQLLSGSHDQTARLWDVAGYEEFRVLRAEVLRGHADALLGATFSPDGSQVATASRDRTARLWDADRGQPLRELTEGHSYLASTVVSFDEGRQLVTSAIDNTTRIWNVATGTQRLRIDGTGRYALAAVSIDGQQLLTGSDDNSAKLFSTETGELLKRHDGHQARVSAVAFSPAGKLAFSGDAKGVGRLWNVETGELLHQLESHNRRITAAAFLPDGSRLLTASDDKTVAVWEVATGREQVAAGLRHPDGVATIALSADGRHLLTSCQDKQLRWWDLATARPVWTAPAGELEINSLALSPDGALAVAAMAGRTLTLWDLATGEPVKIGPAASQPGSLFFSGDNGPTTWGATFLPDGKHLVTVGGSDARLWDFPSGRELLSFSPSGAVAAVAYSPDGKLLATASWDNAAKVWDVETGTAVRKFAGQHLGYVNSVAFSPDGSTLLTASNDGTARLWNVQSGEPLPTQFGGHVGAINAASFSPDGKQVLTAGEDKTARLWDEATGQPLQVLRGHKWGVLCATFSHHGRLIVTGSEDNTARIWNAADGKLLHELVSHTAPVTAAAFTPDAVRLITGSQDQLAIIWDVASGDEILSLKGHTREITAARFSPNGNQALTASRDGTAILWLSEDWRTPASEPAGDSP